MNLTKIHSITKKITVALLGGFLLIFVLFHACANLCILRNDDGAWYSAFCHFMGTNYIIKVFEIILLLTIFCHICITLWLAYTNFKARGSVRYHHASRTKTHTGSKLMAWTGAIILIALVCHFCDFYFVKMGWVEGKYMVKTEDIYKDNNVRTLMSAYQYRMEPKQMVEIMAQQDSAEAQKLEAYLPIVEFLANPTIPERTTADGKWIKNMTPKEKAMFVEATDEIEVEPDFYNMAREKFKDPIIAILYLIFFVVLWFHMRHAFPSAFQTLGLNNYKYNKFLDCCGNAYAWIVCLMFAAIPICIQIMKYINC